MGEYVQAFVLHSRLQRKVFSLCFFLFWFVSTFITRALCGLLNVTVEALCSSLAAGPSSDQGALSSDVAGSAAYVYSVHVYPQSWDLYQIQSTWSNFTVCSMFKILSTYVCWKKIWNAISGG